MRSSEVTPCEQGKAAHKKGLAIEAFFMAYG